MDFVVAGMVATMAGNKLVVALCLVVAIELVELDNLYQFVGITGIGGITGSLESACPSLIVGDREFEKTAIALS